MRVVFIIQGEGRGHMTQAITLKNILEQNGHDIVSCLVGKLKQSDNYGILKGQFKCELKTFASPNLFYDRKTGELSMSKTILIGLSQFGRYFCNLKVLHDTIEKSNADIIINFYDLLGGFYNLLVNHSRVPFVPVAHQYFMMHHSFEHPKGQPFNRFFLNLNSRITKSYASKVLALSFSEEREDIKNNIVVIPPLIREEIINVKKADSYGFVLAYCSQPYMIEDLVKWNENQNEVKCYTSRSNIKKEFLDIECIEFCDIDAHRFIDDMTMCDSVFTTSGFESICEAGYLGKPITIVPMRNHYEQLCNAYDAERIGIASRIETKIDSHTFDNKEFNKWRDRAPQIILNELLSVLQIEKPYDASQAIVRTIVRRCTYIFFYLLGPFYRNSQRN